MCLDEIRIGQEKCGRICLINVALYRDANSIITRKNVGGLKGSKTSAVHHLQTSVFLFSFVILFDVYPTLDTYKMSY